MATAPRPAFCYVDDLIDALVQVDEHCSGTAGPVDFGNPVETTMIELAERVLAIVGDRPGWSTSRCPRTIKNSAVRTFARPGEAGLAPKVALEDGPNAMFAYFRALLPTLDGARPAADRHCFGLLLGRRQAHRRQFGMPPDACCAIGRP